jgi:putative NADH-flavin reductase
VFRASNADVEWTYISPAALIEDGERSGKYRVGGDQLLVDANGISRITVPDYAVALLDRTNSTIRCASASPSPADPTCVSLR